MPSPEAARFDRRINAHDESLRAIADTVVEVKDAVDGHTRQLGEIQQEQERQNTELADIKTSLDEILRLLTAR